MELAKMPPPFTKLINLASDRLGAKAVHCTDDFFAEKENLVKAGRGIFIADKYTDRGKWMDGWESRRKRTEGHDWCIIKLGAAGRIEGLDIDTNHFLGNHPPHASLEVARIENDTLDDAKWVSILDKSPLDPGSQNFFSIENNEVWTHVRLHIYPDGGVARLKVYGTVVVDWSETNINETIDLASALNGAKSIQCNDMFFSHMDNLLLPGKGLNMGDGWETKRNRTPNNVDWVIVKLACPGYIESILVDTNHFKGNYPDACMIQACYSESSDIDNSAWKCILEKQKLSADKEHFYESELKLTEEKFNHIRLNIYPDGGISRLRIYGKRAAS